MKVTKFKEEIESLNLNELREKEALLKKELFSLRLNAATAHLKDYSQYKKLRKDVARVKTSICQKSND